MRPSPHIEVYYPSELPKQHVRGLCVCWLCIKYKAALFSFIVTQPSRLGATTTQHNLYRRNESAAGLRGWGNYLPVTGFTWKLVLLGMSV